MSSFKERFKNKTSVVNADGTSTPVDSSRGGGTSYQYPPPPPQQQQQQPPRQAPPQQQPPHQQQQQQQQQQPYYQQQQQQQAPYQPQGGYQDGPAYHSPPQQPSGEYAPQQQPQQANQKPALKPSRAAIPATGARGGGLRSNPLGQVRAAPQQQQPQQQQEQPQQQQQQDGYALRRDSAPQQYTPANHPIQAQPVQAPTDGYAQPQEDVPAGGGRLPLRAQKGAAVKPAPKVRAKPAAKRASSQHAPHEEYYTPEPTPTEKPMARVGGTPIASPQKATTPRQQAYPTQQQYQPQQHNQQPPYAPDGREAVEPYESPPRMPSAYEEGDEISPSSQFAYGQQQQQQQQPQRRRYGDLPEKPKYDYAAARDGSRPAFKAGMAPHRDVIQHGRRAGRPKTMPEANPTSANQNPTEGADQKPKYKPYNLNDFRKVNVPVKLGGLGFQESEETTALKRMRERALGYAQQSNQVNQVVLSAEPKKPIVNEPPKSLIEAQNRREKMKAFAKAVPKPVVKPKESQPYSGGRGGADEEPMPMTAQEEALMAMEAKHRMDRDAVDSIKRQLNM